MQSQGVVTGGGFRVLRRLVSRETNEDWMSKWGKGKALRGAGTASCLSQPDTEIDRSSAVCGLGSGEWVSVVFVIGKVRTL